MIDGVNRVVLALFAILLIAAGAIALAAAAGTLALAEPSRWYRQAQAQVQADPQIWWPVLIGGAVIVFVLALWWALRQVVVRRPGGGLSTVTLEDGDRGRTTVDAAPVARAAAADLRRLPEVTDSSVRLVSDSGGQLLRTRIDVLTDADLTSVRDAARDVYQRVAELLGSKDLATHTYIRPLGQSQRRVR